MQTTPAVQTPATGQSTPVIVTTGTPPIPMAAPRTVQELEGLRARRSELSTQLSSAANRRERLVRELNSAPPGPARSGLEQRVGVLDQRMVQIESDMAETGRQLSTTQAGILSSQQQTAFGGLSRGDVRAMSSLFIIFVLAPLAIAAARNMWKRGSRPAPLPPDLENARKMEQLQQSVDTIAVEMERVSEGQRFVTKLLSEQHKVPVIASANQTVLQPSEQQR
jgi:chaperonin cofactor prefoldin